MQVAIHVVEIHEGIVTSDTVFDAPNCLYQIGNTVLSGPAGRAKRNGGIKPFKDMSVAELRMECRARGLCDEGYKKDPQIVLKEHLGGIQRVPTMLIQDQARSMKDLHLGM